MAEASWKSYEIDAFLGNLLGKDRVETVADNKCMTCNGVAHQFRDDLSRKEYTISGMCQGCQDKVFGEDE